MSFILFNYNYLLYYLFFIGIIYNRDNLFLVLYFICLFLL